MMDDGTIGDASSGASTRANVDTSALFVLLWNNISNTYAPVSGGRGATAAADFAAHKKITLPKQLGRALAIAGAGSGLTLRTLGQTLGEENHTLALSELPTGISSQGVNSITIDFTSNVGKSIPTVPTGSSITSIQVNNFGGGSNWAPVTGGNVWSSLGTISTNNTISVISSNTGGAAHNVMQPTSFVNVMVKL